MIHVCFCHKPRIRTSIKGLHLRFLATSALVRGCVPRGGRRARSDGDAVKKYSEVNQCVSLMVGFRSAHNGVRCAYVHMCGCMYIMN